jgi:hypothetical protein
MEAEILQNGKPDENISKEEFVYFMFALSERVNIPQFEDQLLSYMQGLNVICLKKNIFLFTEK